VPLRVDGRAAAITGELRHVEPGSAWPWLAGATAAAAAGVLLGAARTSATVATVAAGAVRTGRALYGRPDVAWSGYLDVALTSAFVVALLVWLGAVRGTRGFVACIAGSFAFAEGVVLLPVLARAVALNALPTTASKALVAAALGAGVGAAVAGVRVLIHEDAPA
jgi:hypothetical protein